MPTALYTHPDCLGHVTPPGHPERVERLEAKKKPLPRLVYTVEIREGEAKEKAYKRAGVPEDDTEVLVICTTGDKYPTTANQGRHCKTRPN